MKKLIIAAVVGGIILFLWQTASWTFLKIHEGAYRYAPNQDSILTALQKYLPEEGQYMLPGLPPDAGQEAQESYMNSAEGKPWAVIQWDNSMNANMGMNMFRGFLVNIFVALFLCYLFQQFTVRNLRVGFISGVVLGLAIWLYHDYTGRIWFETPWAVLNGNLVDNIISYGLAGLWMGWYLRNQE